MLSGNKLGDAGARVVIEEFLDGEEASFIVMVDGKNVLALASSQDHKRIGDGDTGPNTGGMGAYSPAPVVTPEIHGKAMREIILPTVQGMMKDGIPYTGFLYAGLMIGKDGSVKTLEFNCRMGDPETQPIMMRLKSNLVDLLEHAVAGTLDQMEAGMGSPRRARRRARRRQLPGHAEKGDVIQGLPTGNSFGEDAHVFHAGTADKDGQVVTAGGRVLCVTALGENVKIAQKRAYEAAAAISWDGMQYRKGHWLPRHLALDRNQIAIGRPKVTSDRPFFTHGVSMSIDTLRLKDYFTGLQSRIVAELEAFDGQPFRTDSWVRPEGGGGISRLIEQGGFFERGGVNFSHVTGKSLPASATAVRRNWPAAPGRRWASRWCCIPRTLLPDGPHERALLRRDEGRRRMSGGSAAAWT